jgi:hypothetical protein
MTTHSPLPVICDRCRAQGLAGGDPFTAFGALLDFDPVPRRAHRADGWDAEVQRAYIAALSLTGADRSACRAVGKSAFGVTQLVAHEGSGSFRAAREEALAMAADERSRRLAEGLRAVAAEQAGWRPADPPWAGAASRRGEAPPAAPLGETATDEERKLRLLAGLLDKFRIKLEQERKARLAGKIAEADFYVRQITCIEVWADIMSGDVMSLLSERREDGFMALQIAETPLSLLLDDVRREHWAACGEPDRPPPPPRDLLVDHGTFSTEPDEPYTGGSFESINAQRREFEMRHRRDAEAQIAWEAEAHRDYERRRDSAADS